MQRGRSRISRRTRAAPALCGLLSKERTCRRIGEGRSWELVYGAGGEDGDWTTGTSTGRATGTARGGLSGEAIVGAMRGGVSRGFEGRSRRGGRETTGRGGGTGRTRSRSSASRRRRDSSRKRSRSVTGRRPGARPTVLPGPRAPRLLRSSSPLKSVPRIHTPSAISGIIRISKCMPKPLGSLAQDKLRSPRSLLPAPLMALRICVSA